MAQKTRAQLEAQIDATIFDNVTGAIDAVAHNTLLNDILDSSLMPEDIPLNTPSPLKTAAISTTEIYLSWNGVSNATSYTVKRGVTTIYTGANLSFIDTGRTIDTSYNYTVIATASGYADSAAASGTQKTLAVMPVLWYEPMGIAIGIDNDYGNTTGAQVDIIKSIVNTSGPTATPADANKRDVSRDGNYSTPTNVFEGSDLTQYDLSSGLSLGDFTVIYRIRNTDASGRGFFGDSGDATTFMSFDVATRHSYQITGTKYRLDLLAAIGDKYAFLVVQRTGTDIRLSKDNGATWDETLVCKTDNFTIDHIFDNSVSSNYVRGLGRMAIFASALTQAQIEEVVNYHKQPAFTPDTVSGSTIDVLGVTYESLTNDYLTGQNLIAQLGNNRRGFPIYNVKDKNFICAHKPLATYEYEDVILTFDHATGKVSSTDIGTNGGTNSHCYGGVFEYDKRIIHQEVDYHYDESNDNSLVLKTSGKNFDFGSISRINLNNGISNKLFSNSNYFGVNVFSDGSVFVVHQENNLAGGNRNINVAKSTDGLNSWHNYRRIIETGDNSRWAYPYLIYNGYNDELLLFINLFDQPNSEFDYLFFLRSTDGLTWKNLEGTFSQNIDEVNPISWASLLANCIVVDATGKTDSTRCHNGHIDSAGEIFGYVGDGDNTFSVIKGTPGGSFAKTAITWDGHTPITSRDIEGGYIVISGSQIDIYHLESQTGKNQIIHIRSVNDGAAWSFIETVTTAAFSHVDIIGTANQGDNNIIASIYDDSGGVPFIKEI